MRDEPAQKLPTTPDETPVTLAERLEQLGLPKDRYASRVLLVGPDSNYHRALGQFIEAFAGCEGVVFSVLTFYAGVSREQAGTAFG